jgi:hypothetical protein
MYMKFGAWNVRSMYRAGSLKVVGVQEVRWDRGDAEPAGNIHFSMGRGIRIMN